MKVPGFGRFATVLLGMARRNEFAVKIVRRAGIPDVIEPIRRYFYRSHIVEKRVGPYEFRMLIDNPLSEAWYEQDHISTSTIFFYKKLLRKGDIVADVGAHNGFYTLLCAKSVGCSGHVFSFEALPSNFETLARNVELNDVKNVDLFNLSIGEKQQSVRFNRYNDGMISDQGRLTVRMDTLSNLITSEFDVLKIDVEGAEYDVLMGALPLLSRNTRIMCEVHPDRLRYFGRTPDDIIQLLHSLGSNIYFWTTEREKVVKYQNEKITDKSFVFACPEEV